MRLVLILLALSVPAAADYEFGANDYVSRAEAVLLVENGDVREVLAGIWCEQTTAVKGRALVFIQPRSLAGHAELAVEVPDRPAPIVWALGPKDTLPNDIAPEGGDGHIVVRTQGGMTLADVRALVTKLRPRDAGLTARVIAAAFFGNKADADATIIAAIYDLARDRPRVTLLSQSKDPKLREAVQRIFGQFPGVPPVNRKYPPVPLPLVAPKIMTPTLVALMDSDPAKFAAAMRTWLDSTVIRDRELRGATTVDKSKWPGADYGELQYSNIERAPLEELLDKRSTTRTLAFAAIVMHAHAERFALERKVAADELVKEPPCSARVKQAAYWEPDDSYIVGPAHAAWARLAACDDADAIALLELAYKLRPDAPVMSAAAARVAAKDKRFKARLLAHVAATGQRAWWAATQLVDEPSLVPIMIGWLRSKDKDTRVAGANILERIDSPAAVPALIAAVRTETDETALRTELSALAPLADKRAFDVLMKVAKSPLAAEARLSLANALAHVGDKRALDVLAQMALDAGDKDLQGGQESVNAFCWISKACEGRAPSDQFGGAVDPEYIKRGRVAIEAWRKK